MTDIKCHTFSEPQPRADLNEDGNFRNCENVRNVGNDRNVMTDIKCLTFSETQARAGLNDDGNFRNGGYFKNVRNVRNAEDRTE